MKDYATGCQGLNRDTFVGVIRYHTRRSLYCLFIVRGIKIGRLRRPSSAAIEF